MHKAIIQLRRELWESRASFVLTPLIMGALLIVLLVIGLLSEPHNMSLMIQHMQAGLGPSHEPIDAAVASADAWNHGLAAIYVVFTVVLLLVLQPYLLSALYSDRRDRSILFWKSLPVGETRNVLTKVAATVLVAPTIYAAVAIATAALYLVILMIANLFVDMRLPGLGAGSMAFITSIFGFAIGWLLLALWALPIFCWLLFCSAIARKAPFLLALGVPLVLVFCEYWLFGTRYLAGAIKTQLSQALGSFASTLPHPEHIAAELAGALSNMRLWFGWVISVLLLVACIGLRSYRYEL